MAVISSEWEPVDQATAQPAAAIPANSEWEPVTAGPATPPVAPPELPPSDTLRPATVLEKLRGLPAVRSILGDPGIERNPNTGEAIGLVPSLFSSSKPVMDRVPEPQTAGEGLKNVAANTVNPIMTPGGLALLAAGGRLSPGMQRLIAAPFIASGAHGLVTTPIAGKTTGETVENVGNKLLQLLMVGGGAATFLPRKTAPVAPPPAPAAPLMLERGAIPLSDAAPGPGPAPKAPTTIPEISLMLRQLRDAELQRLQEQKRPSQQAPVIIGETPLQQFRRARLRGLQDDLLKANTAGDTETVARISTQIEDLQNRITPPSPSLELKEAVSAKREAAPSEQLQLEPEYPLTGAQLGLRGPIQRPFNPEFSMTHPQPVQPETQAAVLPSPADQPAGLPAKLPSVYQPKPGTPLKTKEQAAQARKEAYAAQERQIAESRESERLRAEAQRLSAEAISGNRAEPGGAVEPAKAPDVPEKVAQEHPEVRDVRTLLNNLITESPHVGRLEKEVMIGQIQRRLESMAKSNVELPTDLKEQLNQMAVTEPIAPRDQFGDNPEARATQYIIANKAEPFSAPLKNLEGGQIITENIPEPGGGNRWRATVYDKSGAPVEELNHRYLKRIIIETDKKYGIEYLKAERGEKAPPPLPNELKQEAIRRGTEAANEIMGGKAIKKKSELAPMMERLLEQAAKLKIKLDEPIGPFVQVDYESVARLFKNRVQKLFGEQPTEEARVTGEMAPSTAPKPLEAMDVLNNPSGSTSPKQIAEMTNDQFRKLVEAEDSTGKKKFALTPDATLWGMKQEKSILPELQQYLDAARKETMAQYEKGNFNHIDKTQWFADAIHAVLKDDVGQFNIKTVKGTGIVTGSAAEKWADDFLSKDPRKGSQALLDPIEEAKRIAAVTIKGAAMIERGVRNFSEWSAAMIKEFGEAIKPELKNLYNQSLQMWQQAVEKGEKIKVPEKAEAAAPKTTPPPPEKAEPAIGDQFSGEDIAMRKSAARASESKTYPEEVREKIATAPESFYHQQSSKKVVEMLNSATESELAAVPKESPVYIASKLEQAKRLFYAGKEEAGYSIFTELEKEGTRLGQLINQFKMLEGAKPDHIISIVNKMLKKAGRDALTAPQRQKLSGLIKDSVQSGTELETAKTKWMEAPTPENAAKADAALDKWNQSELEVQKSVLNFTPRTVPGTLKSILQGNLLTPISEVANIAGNMNFLAPRAAVRTLATAMDMLNNFLIHTPREQTVSPIRGTVEAAKGLGRGMAKIPEILWHGTADTIKGEKKVGLHPLEAWVTQFSKNADVPTVGGKIPLSERARLAIEGTFGIPAEVMLRGLGAGDVVFKEAAKGRIIANEAKLAKIDPKNLPMAQKFPELFFDDKTLARIQEETLHSVFQRNSKSLNKISNLLASRGEWVDLLATTVVPYKLTPWNIISEILSYNPLVAMAKTGFNVKNGNYRAAKINGGKIIVGGAMTLAGFWLYKKGLMAPSMDQPDERTKARLLASEVLPPNHINISGLERSLKPGAKNEDAAFRPGDHTVNVFRAGGLAGSIFYMTANIGRQIEKQPAGDESDLMTSVMLQGTLEQARFGVNQSFLQGVSGILQAVKSGETDTYAQAWANAAMSIPLPNTLATISRATRPSKVETDGFKDLVKTRLGVFGTDDQLPPKRGIWGEPIPETPDHRNALIYHFFDITKEKNVTDDKTDIELYKLWRRTGNTAVVPTPPLNVLTFATKTYTLTPEQHSALAAVVGKARRNFADSVIDQPSWKDISDEKKITVLEILYDKGNEIGKANFWRQYRDQLKEKPVRSGFDTDLK